MIGRRMLCTVMMSSTALADPSAADMLLPLLLPLCRMCATWSRVMMGRRTLQQRSSSACHNWPSRRSRRAVSA